MEFLRAILGDDLYKQVETAINAHNGKEENREKQIKVGNLGGGEYTSTAKYNALNDTLTGKQSELDAANNLIAELKKTAKGNEEMQGKFAGACVSTQGFQKPVKRGTQRDGPRLTSTHTISSGTTAGS